MFVCINVVSSYGSVKEIWFDGRKGANGGNMSCYFDDWFAMVKELQRTIHIFSGGGQDMRWIGNEERFAAGDTLWAPVNRELLALHANTSMPQ